MKFNFKKIAAIGASVLMVGMSMGVGAAANFPAPFSGTSASSVGVVVGAAGTDDVAAGSISDYLETKVTGTLVISTDSWPVKTSSDDLELTESIKDVETYIDDSDLTILADGILSNEKGDAKYEQFLYFEDNISSSVVYAEDDDGIIGLFFKINDGAVIARYVMDFTTNLESDIEDDNELSDIEDKDITVLGKTYTITTANNGTSGVELILMSGAEKATIGNDESATVAGKTVSVLVSGANVAQFTVDGVQLDKMGKGETVKLSDGTFLGVTDITYQQFAGGIMQATFHLGADKMELNSGSTMKVNGETIGEAAVTITSTEASSDIAISEIAINMTAEDDLFVGEGKKLSQAPNLDEPEVMFTQNWDIEFNGLDAVNTEEVTFKSSNSDKEYDLKFKNYNGDSILLPVVYATATGLNGGEYDTSDKDELVLNASATITDEDYFVLNTASPSDYSSDARSYVVRYRGSDKTTDSDPKVTFDISGVEDSREVTLDTDGTFNLKLGGSTFEFANTTAGTSNNFNITLTTTQLGYGSVANGPGWLQLRTQNNALVTINDTNTSLGTSSWIVKVDVDDIDKDGDEVSLTTAQNVFSVTLSNDTTNLEVATGAVTSSTDFVTNPDNDDESLVRTSYGAYVSVIDTSTAPAQITVTIPESVVNPLVYISPGTVSGGAAIGSLVFKDTETGWRARNVVLVGGSCINKATAEALNVAYGTCEAAFTTATGVGDGQYLIKSIGDAFESGRIALVVAGYNQADTTAAVSLLRNQPDEIDTAAGSEYLGIVTATGSSSVTKVE